TAPPPSLHTTLSPLRYLSFILLFFTPPATTQLYTLSLHDALPISSRRWRSRENGPGARGRAAHRSRRPVADRSGRQTRGRAACRSEEHTSELQSRFDLVCRLLLEKKKKNSYATEFMQEQYSR